MFSLSGFEPTPQSVENRKKTVIGYSLVNDLPYEEIFNDFLLYKDGSIGACYTIAPIYVDVMDFNGVQRLERIVGSVLKNLDAGTHMQIFWRKDRQTDLIQKHKSQVLSGDPMVHVMTDDRVRHWQREIDEGRVFAISCEIWIRKKYKRSVEKPFNRLVGLTGASASKAISLFLKEHREIERDFSALCSNLMMPFYELTSVRKADADRILNLLWRHFWGSWDSPRYSNDKPLRLNFGGCDVSPKWGYISMGNQAERQVGIVSSDLLPGTSYMTMINHILAVNMPVAVVMNISPIGMAAAKNNLTKTYRRYETLLAQRDPNAEEKMREIFTVMQDLASTNSSLFDTELYVVLEGDTPKDLSEKINHICTTVANGEMDMQMKQEKAALHLAFESTMPGYCFTGNTDRHHRIKTENVVNLMPLYGAPPSASKPVMLFAAPYNTIAGYDLFDSRLPAAHGLIFGGSGSGKSFTTTLLLNSHRAQNPMIYIIDKGGSYKKFMNMIGGSYIDFSNTEFSFNIFEGRKDWEQRKAQMILVLQEMIRESPGVPVSKPATIILERLLETLFASFANADRDPTLSDAYRLLTKRPMYSFETEPQLAKEQEKITLYLANWTHVGSKGTSSVAKYVDSPMTTVSMDSDYIAFNLDGLSQQRAELMNIIFIILNGLIINKVQKEKQRNKIIIFDEVWSLLKTPEGAVFLEELYRTMRKFSCMVLAISQDIADFSSSDVSNALLSNTYQMFIFRQPAETRLADIQKILGLNASEKEIVSRLTMQIGIYSEMFVKIQGIGSGKYRIVPSPMEYWIATTHPTDTKILNNYLLRGLTLEDALKAVSEKYPNGAALEGHRN